LFRILLKE